MQWTKLFVLKHTYSRNKTIFWVQRSIYLTVWITCVSHWPESSDFISQPPYCLHSPSLRLNGSKAPRISFTRECITSWIIFCTRKKGKKNQGKSSTNMLKQPCTCYIQQVAILDLQVAPHGREERTKRYEGTQMI